MKSLIFKSAIINRNRIKFLYGLKEVIVEPYYITKNKRGKKVLYGKVSGTNQIKCFEYEKISNIKTLNYERFSPIIPIIPLYS
ncbi:MAG: hypothetical protein QHH13_08380 [Melioribacter sp.]|uniref:hypothetical protein n=1 Tax=Rosettibacter primus TaxID=3111523 RepID=UPI00247DFD9B|nr:hypothetical protein [Melioribacter sp.]